MDEDGAASAIGKRAWRPLAAMPVHKKDNVCECCYISVKNIGISKWNLVSLRLRTIKEPSMKKLPVYYFAAASLLMAASCSPGPKFSETSHGLYNIIEQKGGAKLGYSPKSGIKIIEADGFKFKDHNRNGKLDKFEDWRVPFKERAADLASRLTDEEIAGLMLYSAHQQIPSPTEGYGASTYNGKPFDKSGAKASDLSDVQKKFLKEDNLRAVLVTKVQSAEVAAEWSNNMQAFCESFGNGIPANNSTDPRHEVSANAEYNYGAGGDISQWPTALGLAATFSPELVEEFGRIAAQEYRALGITTALSPQVDIAMEPRWARFTGTFGEDPNLVADMGKAYIDGFQTTTDKDKLIADGWGYQSVVAMAKHWPGGGTLEGGRDSHYNYGKYAVYPTKNFELQMEGFTKGAFHLNGPTKTAGSIMTFYNISKGIDPSGKNVGESFSKYIVNDLLRNKYKFDGIACTDWMVTADNKAIDAFDGKCWGVENLSEAQRHYEILKAGVDQFGGNNDKGPVLEAFKMGYKEFGEKAWKKRIQDSARRLLLPMFETGLFENPYLDPAETKETVGKKEFMQKGYDAQIKSIVMVKNHDNTLPLKDKKLKVYVPKRYYPSTTNFWGEATKAYWDDPVKAELIKKYYTVVDKPEEADFAICFIQGPVSGPGYDKADVEKGGNGYLPISLQYNDYTATDARATSLAGGDPKESFTNRSYKDKTVQTPNKPDMEMVINTKKVMGNKPVVVAIQLTRPAVLAEIEPYADAILVSFGTSNQPFFEIIQGKNEPSGLLPCQMPRDMKTVETQAEDRPLDMIPYTDKDGNKYDFAFGLNWDGVINDARVQKYARK